MSSTLIKTGDALPNHAVVVLCEDEPMRSNCYPSAIVLAYDHNGYQPWITWQYVHKDDGGRPYCVGGQYRIEFLDALYDYYERLNNERPILVSEVELARLRKVENEYEQMLVEQTRSDAVTLDTLAAYLRENQEWDGGDFCDLAFHLIGKTGRNVEYVNAP